MNSLIFYNIFELGPHHFSEPLFSRTPFSRIVVQPNFIFANRRSTERRFPETSFARTSFCRSCMKRNVISPNTKLDRPRILVLNVLVDERLWKICVVSNWVQVWKCLNMDTVRIRKVRNSGYGRFDSIVVFVPLNAFSGKWCSAKRRFGKMTFGYTTIRKKDIRLNDNSGKLFSTKWCVGEMTFGWIPIRNNDIRRHDVSAKRRFDERTFRENDVDPFKLLKNFLTFLKMELK